jgi:hypothetical protein
MIGQWSAVSCQPSAEGFQAMAEAGPLKANVEQACPYASDRPLLPRCSQPTAAHTAFRLRGWQQDGRQAERLAQRVVVRPEREERRRYTFARQLGKGVRFPRHSAPLWPLPRTPRRLGGIGTNPEYAVKSTDSFLTSLARIQVEIKGQPQVPMLRIPGTAEPAPPAV